MLGEEARPPREIVIRLGPQLERALRRGHARHVLGTDLQLREVLRAHLQPALAGIELDQTRRARGELARMPEHLPDGYREGPRRLIGLGACGVARHDLADAAAAP